MTIHIENLTFDVIIGLFDFERERAQKIIIDVNISYTYIDNRFINYADVATDIHNNLQNEQYALLENALLGLEKLLYKTYPHISTLTLKISKPNILPSCTVALSKTWSYPPIK